jgi:hypothetical protein
LKKIPTLCFRPSLRESDASPRVRKGWGTLGVVSLSVIDVLSGEGWATRRWGTNSNLHEWGIGAIVGERRARETDTDPNTNPNPNPRRLPGLDESCSEHVLPQL